MSGKIITSETREKVIAFYKESPKSIRTVSEEFGLSCPTVCKILSNTPKYTKAQIFNPEYNERFFQNIDNEAKAYFLGLILTDGNIFHSKDGRQDSISITISKRDSYILNRFKDELKVNTSIVYSNRDECACIAVRSNLMAKDLAGYGIIPRKSTTAIFPECVPDNMKAHMIRGILDGDGSIRAVSTNKNNRFAHSISFCGTTSVVSGVADFLFTACRLSVHPSVYTYKDRHLSEVKFQNINDIYLIGEALYRDATIFLVRKKEQYDNFKRHYNLV